MYRSGWGVAQDYTLARRWGEKSAAAGEAEAVNELGISIRTLGALHGIPRKRASGMKKPQPPGMRSAVHYDSTPTEETMRLQVPPLSRGEAVLAASQRNLASVLPRATRDSAMQTPQIGHSMCRIFVFLGLAATGLFIQGQTPPSKTSVPNDSADEPLTRAKRLYSDRQYAQALPLFQKSAAAKGASGEAARYLGIMYESGFGAPKDDARAVDWYRQAAEQGDAAGMRYLGDAYATGLGYGQGFQTAAGAHVEIKIRILGFNYSRGLGVPKDDVKAVTWYRKAADAGDAAAMAALGEMYLNGLGLAKDDSLAAEWFRRGAERGDAGGMRALGVLYLYGIGVPKDSAQGVIWSRKAAESGDVVAMSNLGRMYETALGLPKDDAQAVIWYQRSANAGNPQGMTNLGLMYERGQRRSERCFAGCRLVSPGRRRG